MKKGINIFSLLLLFLLLLCPHPATGQTDVVTATIPSDTDSRINSYNDPHMSWAPQNKARNQLLLFLPGTFGKPRSHFAFAETGASLGYHVVFLMYPDDVAAQQVCPNSADPEAYMKFRLAIIDGGDFAEMHVDQANSIRNRLTKLLLYLSAKQPQLRWEQFLDANKNVDWQKVVVSGQSQGGGHAYVISKFEKVARVICLGSPKDYSFYFNRPAKGFDSETRTPLGRYFAFNHAKDPKGPYARELSILEQIGLTRFGVASVDGGPESFKHAHVLFTDVALENSNAYHGSVLNAGIPACPLTWKYMLTEPVQ